MAAEVVTTEMEVTVAAEEYLHHLAATAAATAVRMAATVAAATAVRVAATVAAAGTTDSGRRGA